MNARECREKSKEEFEALVKPAREKALEKIREAMVSFSRETGLIPRSISMEWMRFHRTKKDGLPFEAEVVAVDLSELRINYEETYFP